MEVLSNQTDQHQHFNKNGRLKKENNKMNLT
jgi:hypothetical protein